MTFGNFKFRIRKNFFLINIRPVPDNMKELVAKCKSWKEFWSRVDICDICDILDSVRSEVLWDSKRQVKTMLSKFQEGCHDANTHGAIFKTYLTEVLKASSREEAEEAWKRMQDKIEPFI